MTKISQYSTDVNITGNDKWIGSDAQNYLITKNFTPNNLANYFNGSNVIDIGTSIRYRYQTLLPGEAREQGTISFETEIGPQVNFSAITTFLIAKNTLKGNTVTQYLDFLVDGKVLLSKASNINIFGYYKITSIEPWIPNTNFFVVEVDFLFGNGFIYEDLDYLVSLVDKVQDIPPPVWGSITGDIEDQTDLIDYISSQITTPTLQEVTDVGNTTTNPIIVGGITSGNLYSDGYNFGISDNYDTNYNLFYTPYVGLQITDTINSIYLYQDASISFQTALGGGNLRSDFLTGYRTLQLPDGDGTLALTTDIPTLTSQLTNDGEDGINPFITLADIPPSTGIESVTGTTVNNTDPLNPVVNVPTLDEVLTAGSSSINKIAYFNSSAPGYSQYGSQIGSNGVYGRITVTGGNYNQFQLSTQYLTVESGDSVGRRKVGVLAPEVLGLGNDITGALGYYNPNYFSLKNSSSNSTVTVQSDLVTGLDKIIKFPNASGTLALTSDIPAAGVTSVGLTMPSAFTVTNSPITSSGDIAVTGAGTASQYVRGDGQLATFPSGGGGGSSVNYYLNGSIAASVATYQQMSNTAIIGAGTDFTKTGNGLIAQFLTDIGNPNRLEIPGGAWNFEMFFSMSSGGGTPKFYVELLKYDGATFTSIASSSLVPETISGGTTIDLYLTSLAVPTTPLLVTDRLAIRVYIVDSTGGRTATLHTENSHLCEIITTFSGGVTSLNGLTANTQYLAVGTGATNFNISSSGDTHTFNLLFNIRRNANNSSNNNINYNGYAVTGSAESSAVWTITRLTIAASGSITVATATNVAWTDRETATYI